MSDLVDSIEALLPQTQCRRCGYADCHAYAEAIATGKAGINRCLPGGEPVIRELAALTGCAPQPLDPALGLFIAGQVAFIDESLCIGCTKCIQACPVDAIVGAPKQMHTIIEALCTGCELCIAPCPVDCIHLQPPQGATEGISVPASGPARANFFREQYATHNARHAREQAEREERLQRAASTAVNPAGTVAEHKREIAAAMARVQARRAQRHTG